LGQRTKAGPNFEHYVFVGDLRQPDDSLDRVGVNDEVLTELLARLKTNLFGDISSPKE